LSLFRCWKVGTKAAQRDPRGRSGTGDPLVAFLKKI
jgi:hypothetical protein